MAYVLTEEEKQKMREAVDKLARGESWEVSEEQHKKDILEMVRILRTSPDEQQEYIEAVTTEMERLLSEAFNRNMEQLVEEAKRSEKKE